MATREAQSKDFALSCPIPVENYPNVLLAHGGGGKLTHDMVEKIFAPTFNNAMLSQLHDGAVFRLGNVEVAFSTDSYVVDPLFFPGGDIGQLAVHGTVNDLAMCGAQALYLSAGFVIEEGLPMDTLWRIARSMREAADAAGVQIVTGDTKVVDRGKGDGVFINTAGVGIVEAGRRVAPDRVQPGDFVVISGDIGRHGIAIMAQRENLAFNSTIESDSAPLDAIVAELFEAGVDVHCLRDATRGGVASAMIEIAESAGVSIEVNETAIPVHEQVRGACEILGLDPLYVANEGRFIAFVAEGSVDQALDAMHAHDIGSGAAVIGRVSRANPGIVTMRTAIGGSIIIDMLSGDQLPRIC